MMKRCRNALAPRILITGALGQIGSELTRVLRIKYGKDNVIATDVRMPPVWNPKDGPFFYLDVEDIKAMNKCAVDNGVDWLIHNTSIMSAKGENDPPTALNININGTRNALEIAKELKLRIFAPSTIAVFGPRSQKVMTPDDTDLCPTTVYGITKVLLEQLGEYYHEKFGVDFRCLRYPGIISHNTLPGGGTTDYAVHIFYDAMKPAPQVFTCGVKPDEPLPMMYMPDCLNATVNILEADPKLLKRRVYNVSSMSFTPAQIYAAVTKHVPTLQAKWDTNHLQDIAHSWPDSVDDSNARRDWGWKPQYDLESMVADMLVQMRAK
jgi:threonine 3-dehydrogenase